MSDDDRFRPLTLKRRVLVAVLAVVTAVTLILMMLERVGAPEIPRPPGVGGPARCAEGQLTGCVGGKADVIFVPAAASRSASAVAPGGGGR